MKANPDKSHFTCSTNDTVNLIVENSTCEKFLGVKFDYKLTFNAHIDEICKKSRAEVKCLIKNSTIHGL